MKRFLNTVFMLLTGVVLGWWLHGKQIASAPSQSSVVIPGSISPAQSAVPGVSAVFPIPPNEPGAATEKNGPATPVQRFRRLLNQQDFDEAVAYYDDTLALGENHRVLLKPVLENYLTHCIEHCREGVFIALVDSWLASHYDDITVLLLLAEYQRRQGFPEEAARVIHMAMTYAYKPNQQTRVTLALQHLVQSSDEYYSQRQQWIELLGFYELLDDIALREPEFGLRQAMIYRLLGETESAVELLLELQASDVGLDSQWTQNLESQLAETAADAGPEAVLTSAVPITKKGDHYLVEITLNEQQVVLMIDTGASVTSLSRSSFNRLASRDYDHLGWRLFNTANGIARGEVYSVNSLVLGNTRLNDIDLAVLDYESSPGMDGLLGMNVLRNYRFEIDQDKQLLHLRAR